MSWTVEQVDFKEIRRRKQLPNYGFIEQAMNGGSAYLVGGKGAAGYFIVASVNSLAPGFVVELALPELAMPDEYAELAHEMRSRSLGVMWFDSSDRDACDFAWRLNLPLRSGPPLFRTNGHGLDVPIEGLEVKTADKGDEAAVIDLLTSAPPDAGGHTREAAIENIEGGCVAVLRKDGDILGAAVVSPEQGPYVALSSVVMKTWADLPPEVHEKAHRELELVFMSLLANDIARRNLQLVYSMARQTPVGYREAIQLNMKLVKQSFTASLREEIPVAQG